MARRKLEQRNIRKLSKGTSSYYVTLPVEILRKLGWRKSQKLVIEADEKKEQITIKDWPVRRSGKK